MPVELASALAAALVLILAVKSAVTVRGMTRLPRPGPAPKGVDLPPVSVIVPARDEEAHIREALASVLALDYPGLEVIAVDDRSTDRTGAILDELAEEHPHLRVLHIRVLPPGWLGKNHALHQGAARARGEFLLFTDADVIMRPDTLARAMGRVREQGLDHLALIFQPRLPGGLLTMLTVDSLAGLLFLLQPWRARTDRECFIGVGAFNLVRAEAYHAVGGHGPIRLCPVDDILLGRLLKEAGYQQEGGNGAGLVVVPWYPSVGAMMRGLRKNLLPAMDYRPLFLAPVTLEVAVFHILPLAGLVLAPWPLWPPCALALAVHGTTCACLLRLLGQPLRALPWFPLSPLVKLVMIWQATLHPLLRGKISWRGTDYSLDELRAAHRSILPRPWR